MALGAGMGMDDLIRAARAAHPQQHQVGEWAAAFVARGRDTQDIVDEVKVTADEDLLLVAGYFDTLAEQQWVAAAGDGAFLTGLLLHPS